MGLGGPWGSVSHSPEQGRRTGLGGLRSICQFEHVNWLLAALLGNETSGVSGKPGWVKHGLNAVPHLPPAHPRGAGVLLLTFPAFLPALTTLVRLSTHRRSPASFGAA